MYHVHWSIIYLEGDLHSILVFYEWHFSPHLVFISDLIIDIYNPMYSIFR